MKIFRFKKKKLNNLFTIIEEGSELLLGENVRFREFNSIVIKNNGKLTIGDNCFFNSYTSISCLNNITIGNNSIFGEGIKIYDHNHTFEFKNDKRDYDDYKLKPVKIGNNCWISSNVIILAGVTIGDNVVIGAGCLIYEDIASGKIVKLKQDLIVE